MINIQSKIDSIRGLIKLYLLVEGIAKALGITMLFLGLIIFVDYFPTRIGLTELPLIPRSLFLAFLLGIFLVFAIKIVIVRLLVPINDNSIKLLIERSHPDFADRLLTLSSFQQTNDLNGKDRQISMLRNIESQIGQKVEDLQPIKLFSFRPLTTSLLLFIFPSLLIAIALACFPVISSIALERNLLLSKKCYPREIKIEEVSIRIVHPNPLFSNFLTRDWRTVTNEQLVIVGKDSSLEFSVSAEWQSANNQKRTPHSQLVYQFDNGLYGQIPLTKIRASGDGNFELLSIDEIQKNLVVSGKWWLHIGDATWGPIRIEVLNPPELVSIKQNIVYPAYLTDSAVFTNGPVEFVNGNEFPQGSRFDFQLEFDRENLKSVLFWNGETGDRINPEDLLINKNQISFSQTLKQDTEINAFVIDSSELGSNRPIRITSRVIKDKSPKVNILPSGVGTAVTPNAVIPLVIFAEDEFGIRDGKILVSLDSNVQTHPIEFNWDVPEKKTVNIDLREIAKNKQLNIPDSISKPLKLSVATLVSDHFPDREATEGQVYEFEIVNEMTLIQLVERQEASLRKRLEMVYDEMNSIRRLLLAATSQFRENVPKTESSKNQTAEDLSVYIQRALLQTQKSSNEIQGVVVAFEELIIQLKNNRLKVTTKQLEMNEKIGIPLNAYAKSELNDFLVELQRCKKGIWENQDLDNDDSNGQLQNCLTNTLDLHEKLMANLFIIIQRMVKFETQNELLDSVRELIEEHQAIMRATEKELERRVFEGILD